MATKIRGITIELGADTTKLTQAFKTVTKELNTVDKSLKDVNKLLKLDPKNVELLGQKQGYLNSAIELTEKKLEEEKKLLEQMPNADDGSLTEQQKAMAREIESTTLQLEKYKSELEETNTSGEQSQSILDKIKDKFKSMGDEAEKSGDKASKMSTIMTGLNSTVDLISKGVSLAKDAYDKFVGSTVQMADELMTQSSVTGLSTDALQEYAYMAELVDTDVSTITGSLTKLTKNMQTASGGTGDAYKAFQQLGIEVTNSDGSLRDAQVVFEEALTALGGMTNETEKNALAMQIFGKSAQELNPLIDAGAESIEAYRQQAHDMGYVLDGETLEALGGIDDTMQQIKNQMDTATNQIAVALMPVVSEITSAFVEWAGSVDWVKVGNTIKTVCETIAKAIGKVIEVVKTIIEWAGKAIETIKAIFTGKFEFPKIKLPHFGIQPKDWHIGDLLKGVIPKLGIEWWAKGYEGMVLDGATIFGMNRNGDLMAGGERGREIIIGENKLKSMLGGAITININEVNNPEATAQAVMNRLRLEMATEGRTWR